jgi:hypothetical protein
LEEDNQSDHCPKKLTMSTRPPILPNPESTGRVYTGAVVHVERRTYERPVPTNKPAVAGTLGLKLKPGGATNDWHNIQRDWDRQLDATLPDHPEDAVWVLKSMVYDMASLLENLVNDMVINSGPVGVARTQSRMEHMIISDGRLHELFGLVAGTNVLTLTTAQLGFAYATAATRIRALQQQNPAVWDAAQLVVDAAQRYMRGEDAQRMQALNALMLLQQQEAEDQLNKRVAATRERVRLLQALAAARARRPVVPAEIAHIVGELEQLTLGFWNMAADELVSDQLGVLEDELAQARAEEAELRQRWDDEMRLEEARLKQQRAQLSAKEYEKLEQEQWQNHFFNLSQFRDRVTKATVRVKLAEDKVERRRRTNMNEAAAAAAVPYDGPGGPDGDPGHAVLGHDDTHAYISALIGREAYARLGFSKHVYNL